MYIKVNCSTKKINSYLESVMQFSFYCVVKLTEYSQTNLKKQEMAEQ